ncbi:MULTISPECIES: type II secretion system protein GspM [Pseudomonas]|jgi:type II secretion system protein M (XcpZ-type)|uniref:Type II secretion system protein GspM n=1 Tax=Pseudomonas putida TaxID=303 RepID=A0A7U6M0G0_PSEPU|nr:MULTISPECIES: type II secretion system protein GspM [Pseudomonas]MBB3270611.1 type II secretion system protein M (XcpZ-type) [Pseudomonas sp. OG7]MBH3396831.1 type II secretion system protein GspM [Pseudomonas monteilii]MCJ7851220.1 type II secretion system protein GspM [Pseudomonas monteilii]MDD2122839.1 type II secretion system protein GspM [Pseudomonas monteilii]NBB06304.1 type II secretion system protein GspM [Pseudomonas monteilii]
MNRDWMQRHRLKFAWLLIAVLLAFLALRGGLAQWRELSQWQGLAEQAASLQGGPGLSMERLKQSAEARRVALAEVDEQGKTWHMRGQVADERALQDWLQALRTEGVQPLQWGLEQDGKVLRFDLVMQP